MYVRVETAEGQITPQDLYLSLRVGSTQKQSRFCEKKCFQFPDPGDGRRNLGRVEIYRRIGTANVDFSESDAGDLQDVSVACKDLEVPCIRIRVAASADKSVCDDEPMTKPQKEQKMRQRFDEAQKYMKDHQLNDLLSETLREVIRAKPDDPHEFMSEEIRKRSMKLPPLRAPSKGTNIELVPQVQEKMLEALVPQVQEKTLETLNSEELRMRALSVLTAALKSGKLQQAIDIHTGTNLTQLESRVPPISPKSLELTLSGKVLAVTRAAPEIVIDGSTAKTGKDKQRDQACDEHHAEALADAHQILQSVTRMQEEKNAEVLKGNVSEAPLGALLEETNVKPEMDGIASRSENASGDKAWDEHHAEALANANQALHSVLLSEKMDVKPEIDGITSRPENASEDKAWDEPEALANANQALQSALQSEKMEEKPEMDGITSRCEDASGDKAWDEHHAEALANASQALQSALLSDKMEVKLEMDGITGRPENASGDKAWHEPEALANANQALQSVLLQSEKTEEKPEMDTSRSENGTGDKAWNEPLAEAVANANHAPQSALQGSEKTNVDKQWDDHHAEALVNAQQALQSALLGSEKQGTNEEIKGKASGAFLEDAKNMEPEKHGTASTSEEASRDKAWDEHHTEALTNEEGRELDMDEESSYLDKAKCRAINALNNALLDMEDEVEPEANGGTADESAERARRSIEHRASVKIVCAAVIDGALVRLHASEDPMVSLRKRTSRALLESASNGKLEEALASELESGIPLTSSQTAECDDGHGDLQKRLQDIFSVAAKNGELDKALTLVRARVIQEKPIIGAENGEPENALSCQGAVQSSSDSKSDPQSIMSETIASALYAAASDGRLSEALSALSISEEPSTQDFEPLRRILASTLLEAVDNGTLFEKLEINGNQDDHIRRALANALRDAVENNTLERQLSTRSQDRTTDTEEGLINGKTSSYSNSSSDRDCKNIGDPSDAVVQKMVVESSEGPSETLADWVKGFCNDLNERKLKDSCEPAITMREVAELVDTKIDARLESVTRTISQEFDEKINRLIASLRSPAMIPS